MDNTKSDENRKSCSSASCGCGSSIQRRDFLAMVGAGAGAVMLPVGARVMAGPFAKADTSKHLVPADKKLADDWVDSLTQRGQAEVFSGKELKYVTGLLSKARADEAGKTRANKNPKKKH